MPRDFLQHFKLVYTSCRLSFPVLANRVAKLHKHIMFQEKTVFDCNVGSSSMALLLKGKTGTSGREEREQTETIYRFIFAS